jgi:hypothetical protein
MSAPGIESLKEWSLAIRNERYICTYPIPKMEAYTGKTHLIVVLHGIWYQLLRL